MIKDNVSESPKETPEIKNTFRYFPFFNHKQALLFLAILGVVFYSTSLNNEYALDDGIVIHQNEYVLKGVEGIPDILSKDAFSSFYRRMCASDQLAGGRYRPLSVITFALEQQLIQPYRTGYYMKVEDSNNDGVLNKDKVTYINSCGAKETNYEYNSFIDQNNDGIAQGHECNACWDRNSNFENDPEEDLNQDGVFNEVDCQVYGATLRHFNNIWTYVLACLLIYLVFKNYFFKQEHDLAFLAALIFLAHPVHSEVVANIKGRDDIFSMIFMALTFLFGFRFMLNEKRGSLALASFFFLLALLSKEFAVLMLLLLPAAIHVFTEEKMIWKKFIPLCLSFLVIVLAMIGFETAPVPFRNFPLVVGITGLSVFTLICLLYFNRKFAAGKTNKLMAGIFWISIFYTGLRIYAVNMGTVVPDTEILNNPFLYASETEKFATKIFVMLKYLVISVVPHPLISDYSYSSIQYRNLSDWDFILSLVLNSGLLVSGIWLTIKRKALGFAIITYFAFLIAAGNFVMGSAVMMLEGNLFHASLGFAIAMAWLLLKGTDKLRLSFSVKRTLLISFLLIVMILYGLKTRERNLDWKNDVTLFLKDVKNAPHSVLVLGNAGARWIDLADTKEITGVHMPGQDTTFFNDYNGTLKISEEEMKEGGFKNKREAALYKGIGYLKHAIELHPTYVNGYLNLGLAHFKLKKDFETLYYWKLAERLYPNNPYLRNYYVVYNNTLISRGNEAFDSGDFKTALSEYNKAVILQPDKADNWYRLGGAHYNLHNFSKAAECWKKTLRLNPDHEEAAKIMQTPDMIFYDK